jgi:hypothetical protein
MFQHLIPDEVEEDILIEEKNGSRQAAPTKPN